MKGPLTADELDRLVKENEAEIDTLRKDLKELEEEKRRQEAKNNVPRDKKK